jgi:hypothetical protein
MMATTRRLRCSDHSITAKPSDITWASKCPQINKQLQLPRSLTSLHF